jgi:hypothetical protein
MRGGHGGWRTDSNLTLKRQHLILRWTKKAGTASGSNRIAFWRPHTISMDSLSCMYELY